jgi:eukaryotic-like serine/threonine-protein kinase
MIDAKHRAGRVVLVSSLLLLLFSLEWTRARAATTPRIVVKPNTGPPTVPFTVKGEGFLPQVIVTLSLDKSIIKNVETSPEGTFTTIADPYVGAETPGKHFVIAHQGVEVSTTYLIRTNWPRYHFDNANTGFNPYENILETSNVGFLVERWTVPLGGSAAPDPIVAYGRVYMAATDGVVRALDRATGSLLWSFDSGGSMSGTAPTAANNFIYVGNQNGDLYALSASTGRAGWVRHLGVSISDSPIVSTGALYVNVFAGTRTFLYSIDPLTGATNYFSNQALSDVPPPTLAYGLVFDEGGIGCVVQALDADTGTETWFQTFCSESDYSKAVAAANDLVFEGDEGGTHALDPDTGDVVWTSSPTLVAPSVADGVVYAASSQLSALDADTGTVLWSASLVEMAWSSPVVANGVVYLGQGSGTLHAYDVADGTLMWTSPVAPADFTGNSVVSDGILYASGANGTVYAFCVPFGGVCVPFGEE